MFWTFGEKRFSAEEFGTHFFTAVAASCVTRLGYFSTLGNFLQPLALINLPKSPTFRGYFCKGVKIYHFSSEIIFGQLLQTFGDFFWSHWLWHRKGNNRIHVSSSVSIAKSNFAWTHFVAKFKSFNIYPFSNTFKTVGKGAISQYLLTE